MRLIAASLLLLTSPSWGISNIASRNPGLPEQGVSGQVLVGIDGKTGNQKEEDYQASARLTLRQGDNVLLGIMERNYGKTQRLKDTDDAFAHGRWTHLLTPLWAAEGFVQWEENEFSNLNSRVLVGGGGRYLITQSEDYSLAVGLGAFREREQLDLQTFQQTTYAWRVNSFYAYQHRINPQLMVLSTAYLQPEISNVKDVRVLFTLGLSVELTQTLDLELSYKATHDSQPAQNLQADPPIDNYRTNTEYSTSLVYNF